MIATLDPSVVEPCTSRGSILYLSKITAPIAVDHQLVMRGFPMGATSTPRNEFGVLYRAEPDGSVIVQSWVKPDWSRCLPASVVQSKQYEPKIVEGASYYVRFSFNSIEQSNNGEKVIEPKQWLERRDIGGAIAIHSHTLSLEYNRSRQHLVPVNKATIDGIITVTDKDKLLHCIRTGVGRAKAYGCGLISLAGV